MLFDRLFEFLALYLALLAFISLMGMKFSKKHQELNALNTQKKKSLFKGLYKHCPCRKAVENGLMSSICIYSSIAGFMLSIINIALMSDYTRTNFIVLILSLICAYLGWVLKK